MRKTYKNALMWALYGVLFLFMTVFQTVTFGRMRLFGVKLSQPIIPGLVVGLVFLLVFSLLFPPKVRTTELAPEEDD